MLILRRIEVRYRLLAPAGTTDAVERVHGMHARHCPVYRSLEGAIEITTRLEIEEEG